jgi:hypothetical protein
MGDFNSIKALAVKGQRIKTSGEGTPKGSPHESKSGGGNITGGKYGGGGKNGWGAKGLNAKVKSGKMKEMGKGSSDY